MSRSAGGLAAALAGALVAVVTVGCSGGGGDAVESTTTAPKAPTTTEVPIGHGQQVEPSTYIPAIGDCFDRRVPDPEKPFTEVILILPCREPHTYEVFDLWQPENEADPDTGKVPYPDQDDLRDEARNICVAALKDFVGVRYELSSLEVDVIVPTMESWSAGNRAVGCLAFDRDGEPLEGSQRDAKI